MINALDYFEKSNTLFTGYFFVGSASFKVSTFFELLPECAIKLINQWLHDIGEG